MRADVFLQAALVLQIARGDGVPFHKKFPASLKLTFIVLLFFCFHNSFFAGNIIIFIYRFRFTSYKGFSMTIYFFYKSDLTAEPSLCKISPLEISSCYQEEHNLSVMPSVDNQITFCFSYGLPFIRKSFLVLLIRHIAADALERQTSQFIHMVSVRSCHIHI